VELPITAIGVLMLGVGAVAVLPGIAMLFEGFLHPATTACLLLGVVGWGVLRGSELAYLAARIALWGGALALAFVGLRPLFAGSRTEIIAVDPWTGAQTTHATGGMEPMVAGPLGVLLLLAAVLTLVWLESRFRHPRAKDLLRTRLRSLGRDPWQREDADS